MRLSMMPSRLKYGTDNVGERKVSRGACIAANLRQVAKDLIMRYVRVLVEATWYDHTCVPRHVYTSTIMPMVRMSYTCLLTNVCIHRSFYPWVALYIFRPLNRTRKFTITYSSDSLSALEGHARLVLNGPNRAANLWSRDSN